VEGSIAGFCCGGSEIAATMLVLAVDRPATLHRPHDDVAFQID
jgi:hypothetical protein